MRSHVAFLRGINVGGKAIISMKQLAEIADRIGLASVKTYLQSGNIVFSAPDDEIDAKISDFERAIETEFGFRPAILVRSAEEMASVMAMNPFTGNGVNPSRLITVFLRSMPKTADIERLEPSRFPDVSIAVLGQEMYVLYSEGMGNSKFVPAYYEPRLGTVGTARNWNTVAKIRGLLSE
jgi:uncharacterized protein (DUF1697 family)